ncbi:MAG: DUF2267 domain-containing protein [Mesorhizobium sp.]|uniref:DUF2267 domain-containing protein n=1 Tax=Mesorhizobium sp. TaxID=1871066 RepID=UPI00121F4D89|nr:DUF2267 domain-containing protein [Mesorhizobium sp.]TIS96424.1 MAG: DUF2267 domain-containing protein [Mesorhizobium sp.]TIT53660.1 MAG: DUF2267 domain-containing protein [Mesorhizobium sp.]
MSATGLEVFDKTLQTTHIWLDEIMADHGPDRRVAWHMLGAVLRTLRDWLQIELAANLGAELPLLIRGAYYDRYRPHHLPTNNRSLEEFLQRVAEEMKSTRPVNPEDATRSVFKVLAKHVDLGQSAKVRDALPKHIQALWPESVGV